MIKDWQMRQTGEALPGHFPLRCVAKQLQKKGRREIRGGAKAGLQYEYEEQFILVLLLPHGYLLALQR